MSLFLSILLGNIFVVGACYFLLNRNSPSKKEFDKLKEPRIIKKADHLALMVSFSGNPNRVLGPSYKQLFKWQSKIISDFKTKKREHAVARFNNMEEILANPGKKHISGYVAVPVPEDSMLPKGKPENVSLEFLGYNFVAEVVHFGSYKKEKPTIAKLKAYIEEQGYLITGQHEEEYIVGPGQFEKLPMNYITIIRYPVIKKEVG